MKYLEDLSSQILKRLKAMQCPWCLLPTLHWRCRVQSYGYHGGLDSWSSVPGSLRHAQLRQEALLPSDATVVARPVAKVATLDIAQAPQQWRSMGARNRCRVGLGCGRRLSAHTPHAHSGGVLRHPRWPQNKKITPSMLAHQTLPVV
jgi:hypothetical protein